MTGPAGLKQAAASLPGAAEPQGRQVSCGPLPAVTAGGEAAGGTAADGGDVLLVGHTRLSLGYVLDHYQLLRQDLGLRFTLTRAPNQYPAGVEEMMGGAGLPRMPYCVAVRRAWDLALFGTNGSEIFFTAAAARVHIQHGLGAGKLVDGQDYTYGPKWALWKGTPKYDRMLEASHAVPRRAVAAAAPASGSGA